MSKKSGAAEQPEITAAVIVAQAAALTASLLEEQASLEERLSWVKGELSMLASVGVEKVEPAPEANGYAKSAKPAAIKVPRGVTAIVKALKVGQATPSIIAGRADLSANYVSATLPTAINLGVVVKVGKGLYALPG